MDLKSHAFSSLNLARRLTTGMLKDFETREQWLFQSHPTCNHALWIAAHLGLADNAFASRFRPQIEHLPAGWKELFWFGSQVSSDSDRYPGIDEVTEYFHERRNVLLQVLSDLSAEELTQPAPPADAQSPIAGAPNIGQAFFFIAYHEGVHCGQLSVARRGLGNEPLYRPHSVVPSDGTGA